MIEFARMIEFGSWDNGMGKGAITSIVNDACSAILAGRLARKTMLPGRSRRDNRPSQTARGRSNDQAVSAKQFGEWAISGNGEQTWR
ncbi:hypothetical protein [Novosphingobium sp. ZW T3_23]|uniref:hypothetical protein n=1 Tax=Novosphingobium sp. ZW T3_23 TaxID=3378084 RepID=UPI0038547676